MNPMGKRDERNCATLTDWLPLSLGEGGLEGLPLRATFSPAHPLARRDVPFAQVRVFRFFIPLLKGVAKAALNCAHRTSTFL